MVSIDSKVRDWIMTLPGLIEASSPDECIRKAWAASGVESSVRTFEIVLSRLGYRPVCVRNDPMIYRLQLPSPSPGVRGAENRLRV